MNNPSTCPHFSECSGCELGENFFEPPIWKEALAFFRKWAIEPNLVIDGFSQTRMKAKLAVRKGPEIGLFKKHTHEVLSIPHCLVHHEAINRAVAFIREEITHSDLSLYQEKPPGGYLRYLQLFVEKGSGLIQLALVVNANQMSKELERFCKNLLKRDLWHSVWVNFQPEANNAVLGQRWQLIEGEPFLWQTLNQTQIAFHPGAFSQTHLSLFEQMLKKIDSWVRSEEKVIELYAGVGAIGLTVCHKTKKLHLVENNPFAHLSFLETQKRLQSSATYQTIDAKEADISDNDLIIVDPPRKGLDPAVLKKLCELKNSRLIYVSCGFESFQRDSELLLQSGWKIKEANGYLLFPGTNHVEILALFYC